MCFRVCRYASYIHTVSMWWAKVVITIAGVFLATSAIRHSLVEMLPELNLSGIFPPIGSSSRRPLPSTGSLWDRFPGLLGTMGRSDSPPSVPVGSFPRPAVPSRAPCFAPAIGEALPMTDQGFGLPAPLPAFSGWRRWGLPGSWRTFDRMPCFNDSGGPAMPGRCGIGDVAFPLHVQGRRPRKVISELSTQPTISLSTLHPFGYPRGARLASGWRPPLAGRDSYPQGPFERFPRLRCHL